MNTIVMSGGGVLGFVHLGTLQYLYDRNRMMHVKKIIGTSIGAIIGYLLCLGYHPMEICIYLIQNNIFKNVEQYNLINLFHGKQGAWSFDWIENALEKMTLAKIDHLLTLQELKEICDIHLLCVSYNYTKKEETVIDYVRFPDMPCLTALRMTANLPFIFEPFTYENNVYFDGVLSSNFPIHLVQPDDRFVGICVSRKTQEGIMDVWTLLWDILWIPVHSLEEQKNKMFLQQGVIVDVQIKHTLPLQLNMDKTEILDLFSLGYQRALETL